MKASESGQDISPEHFRLSNEQMFLSIKASMGRLEVKVSDMVEILEAWEPDSIKVPEEEMI